MDLKVINWTRFSSLAFIFLKGLKTGQSDNLKKALDLFQKGFQRFYQNLNIVNRFQRTVFLKIFFCYNIWLLPYILCLRRHFWSIDNFLQPTAKRKFFYPQEKWRENLWEKFTRHVLRKLISHSPLSPKVFIKSSKNFYSTQWWFRLVMEHHGGTMRHFSCTVRDKKNLIHLKRALFSHWNRYFLRRKERELKRSFFGRVTQKVRNWIDCLDSNRVCDGGGNKRAKWHRWHKFKRASEASYVKIVRVKDKASRQCLHNRFPSLSLRSNMHGIEFITKWSPLKVIGLIETRIVE